MSTSPGTQQTQHVDVSDSEAVVIFGEVLFDCFEDGSRVLGGAPFNVAWHLRAFGVDPILVSRVGADENGERIRRTMAQWGMRTDGLQTDVSHPTGEVRVRLRDGQPEFEIVPDQAYDHIVAEPLRLRDNRLLYHGSLATRARDSDLALRRLRDVLGSPVFVDVNLRKPWWDAERVAEQLAAARWVKLNEDELALLTADLQSLDLESRARRMLERHALELLVVTQGEKGAIALDAHGRCSRSEPKDRVQVVDTVGAGDGFASVCILGLLRGWPTDVLLQRAQQFASRVVGYRGATISDGALYHDLLDQWQVD